MKRILKAIASAIAFLIALPFIIIYFLSTLLIGRNRALEDMSQFLSLFPGLSGSFIRRAFLRCVLDHCAATADIGFGTLFSQCGAKLDENIYIGPRCHLGLVHLKKNVLLAAGVHVPSGGKTHFFDDPETPIKDQGGERTMVTIGEGAWIGSGAIVLADVGAGTIVGAGSVVTKPLPENVIAAGVPAKVIRPRFSADLPAGD
jgi:acetyltransferase-like isoleucine patch superfamily enzyme